MDGEFSWVTRQNVELRKSLIEKWRNVSTNDTGSDTESTFRQNLAIDRNGFRSLKRKNWITQDERGVERMVMMVDVLPEWTVRGVKSSGCIERKDGFKHREERNRRLWTPHKTQTDARGNTHTTHAILKTEKCTNQQHHRCEQEASHFYSHGFMCLKFYANWFFKSATWGITSRHSLLLCVGDLTSVSVFSLKKSDLVHQGQDFVQDNQECSADKHRVSLHACHRRHALSNWAYAAISKKT